MLYPRKSLFDKVEVYFIYAVKGHVQIQKLLTNIAFMVVQQGQLLLGCTTVLLTMFLLGYKSK